MTNPRLIGLAAAAALLTAAAPGPTAAQVAIFDRGSPLNVPVTTFRDIRFKTVVRQQYDYSCGSASLATLLRHHYGRPLGEAEIFKAMWDVGDQAQIQKVGFSLLDMKRYLESLGYKAEGYQISLEELMASKEPMITIIDLGQYRHFVVVKGARDGQVLVGDPAQGLRTYSAKEFRQLWQPVVLVIEQAGRPAFNREAEWRPYGSYALGEPLGDDSLASLTRELPPRYQITPVFNLP
ncbi:C39 family peptidase [Phenylobacterium sp.]|jgi:hypothetical protein|uniref:C39 family peptidase n=1 Tax=Phenylobacterium sp. TaxID=1871053 RepID=UPI002E36AF04|nr:C39 family peptidase [Phenylobacterium sp.]HEX2561656.1 C39 family peptidase [Phenylobacterium sp.]